jgi:hypothetical protein
MLSIVAMRVRDEDHSPIVIYRSNPAPTPSAFGWVSELAWKRRPGANPEFSESD